MPWPQGTHSAHITEKCVYEATCDKINVVQKELLNAEWVLEREINRPSIWPALPPQPQEVPLPPRRGGSSPTHTGTPTCCRRGASPWVHQPAPCLPPSCPCKDDAQGSGWLPALPRVGVSEQLLSAAYLQAPRSDSPLHYQPYTGTGFRSPKHPEVKMKALVAELG